jgi:tight adherence protein C
MILLLLIGLVLVGTTVWLVARSASINRLRAAERLDQITSYGFSDAFKAAAAATPAVPAVQKDRAQLDETLAKVATRLGEQFVTRVPGQSEPKLRKLLDESGHYSFPTARFAGIQAAAGILIPAFWLLLTVSAGKSPVVIVLGTIVALILGWVGPILVLKRQGALRLERIEYTMPELIDTLVTTVEAGIAFTASLQIAGNRFKGPLGEELRLTIQEQNMGLGLSQALAHMVERCDCASIRSFARSVTQGELLGVSISQSLRDLSSEMRKRRRAMAEERAQKVPVKILFPLVFLMFPAMFIVLLGPAMLQIGQLFGG